MCKANQEELIAWVHDKIDFYEKRAELASKQDGPHHKEFFKGKEFAFREVLQQLKGV